MRGENFKAYLALAVVCLAWGTTYLALRVGVLEFPPFLFTAIRQLIAGVLLAGVILLFKKKSMPSKEVVINQAIGGFFMISMGNGFVGWAEVHIPSGIAAILCSMIPIWVILINLFISAEDRPTMPIVFGFLVGLFGIVLIFSENLGDFASSQYLLGILMIFLASIGWAGGSIWMKRKNQSSDPFLNAGLQMVFGGIFLIPISLVFDDYQTIQWSNNVIYSLIYLILIGSIAAYACYSYAIKKLPVAIVTLYAYVNPIVAVILGWAILDEKLNSQMTIAIGITLAGIYIVNRGYQLRRAWKPPVVTNP
ncbi:MAG: EamA family transporter [Cyclobacteriaceae bacterium]